MAILINGVDFCTETKPARELAFELMSRYETSAKEGPGENDFTCRRCLKRCGEENGGDDLGGLCDDCWVEVDLKFRDEQGKPHYRGFR